MPTPVMGIVGRSRCPIPSPVPSARGLANKEALIMLKRWDKGFGPCHVAAKYVHNRTYALSLEHTNCWWCATHDTDLVVRKNKVKAREGRTKDARHSNFNEEDVLFVYTKYIQIYCSKIDKQWFLVSGKQVQHVRNHSTYFQDTI